ncbi:CAP domain-containing protein [Lactobacillaceae bacterium Scapto_B20]
MKLLRFRSLILTFVTTITLGVISPTIMPSIDQPVQAATSDTISSNQLLTNTNNALIQYKIGQKAIYYGDNNRVVLANFPTSETDDLNTMHNNEIDNVNGIKYARVKIIAKKVAPWKVHYYLIKFNDGLAGWVNNGDLHPLNFYKQKTMNYNQKTYQKAAQNALNYLNAVRDKHGLSQLTWDPKLAKIAQLRGPQMSVRFAHNDESGVPYREIASQQLGYGDLGNYTSENIANANNYRGITPAQSIIQRMNSMLYEDGPDSKWGHRNIFLDPNINKIGINIQTNNKMYNMAFIME